MPQQPEPEPEPALAPAAPSTTHGTFRARAVMYVLIAMFEMTNCERDQQELCLALHVPKIICAPLSHLPAAHREADARGVCYPQMSPASPCRI